MFGTPFLPPASQEHRGRISSRLSLPSWDGGTPAHGAVGRHGRCCRPDRKLPRKSPWLFLPGSEGDLQPSSQNVTVLSHIAHRPLFGNSPGRGQGSGSALFFFSPCLLFSSRLYGQLPKPLGLWHLIKLSYCRSGSNTGRDRQGLETATGGERHGALAG